MTYLTKNLAYFSNLDGMQAICAEKTCAEKSSSETPLQPHCVRQIPLFVAARHFPPKRGKSALKGAPLRSYRKVSRRAAASAGSRRGSCRLPLRPLPVKMQCRSVRRRSGIALLKIIFPLIMAKAHAAAI
jgi:hypothetical protein